MMTSIEIENLRGIRSGRLEGLAPLTILTGPNGCGKSTVLDALLIVGSSSADEAVGKAVQRHPAVLGGAKWLFGPGSPIASLKAETSSGKSLERKLQWREYCDEDLRDELLKQGGAPPFSMISLEENMLANHSTSAYTAFSVQNQYVGRLHGGGGPSEDRFVRLVDPGLPNSLQQTFTAASRAGRRDDIFDLLSPLIPRFERLEILVEDDDTPSLYVASAGKSVPVGLAGDGVQAFIQLALEMAVVPGGLVLLEEPEVYQHPKAIWQTALAILANVRRGVQVVVTTHSLELIDALLAEASEEDLEGMAVFNLLLKNGKLVKGYQAGEDISFARQTLENDLR